MSSEIIDDWLAFLDASPTPWHAVEAIAARLTAASYTQVREVDPWQLAPGRGYFTVRDDGSVVAFVIGEQGLAGDGFRMVGAHTDSPGLRIKPRASQATDGLLRLGVEIYGSPILATFADRDLTLAGRVVVRCDGGLQPTLVRFDRPLLRLPNLAIHMNRGVNEEGLKFNKQTELPLMLGGADGTATQERLLALLGEQLGCAASAIAAFELAACDTQAAVRWGVGQEFIASGRLDNLASCHAGLCALRLAPVPQRGVNLFAAFDHEEIGSASHKGAAGSFLSDTLSRIGYGIEVTGEQLQQALARSLLISADMAHAYHPNFPGAYENDHTLAINGGPAIKRNASQRYASEAFGEALFARCCAAAQAPWQHYCHRSDLPCGSTIGPILAARIGVRTVDVGSPLWAMHSIRESAGILDHRWMADALTAFYSGAAE